MKTLISKYVAAALLGAALCGPAFAGQFRIPVGLSYASGIHEAADKVFDLYENAGFDVDDRWVFPLGVSVNPYYEFDNGFGIGMSLGPTAFLFVEEKIEGFHSEDKWSAIIPIGVDVRYTFLRDHPVSPYLRVGVRYPIITGDFLESSQPGPFGAIGVELWRKNAIGMGVEFGYDASRVTVSGPESKPTKDVAFSGFMVSVFAVF